MKEQVHMKLSIIIPYYNLEDWLFRRCLDSILDQLPDNRKQEVEVIVVDDGSETPPTQVTKDYPACQLYVLHQPHRRLGAARNRGMEVAQGRYILFVDGDDYLYPGTLCTLMDKATDTGCDVLDFAYRPCTEAGRVCPKQTADPFFSPPQTGECYMKQRPLYGTAWHYLFSRQLAERMKLRFAEGVFIEDEVFTTLLFHHARQVVTTNLTAYAYYRRPGSITSDHSIRRQRELLHHHTKALETLAVYCRQLPPHEPADGLRQKIALLAMDCLRRLFRDPAWEKFWPDLRKKMEELSLYPLTPPAYGWKFNLFCRLANNAIGRRLLAKIRI